MLVLNYCLRSVNSNARRRVSGLRTAAFEPQPFFLPPERAAQLGQRGRGKGGARQLRRLIQKEVEGPLAGYLLGCSRRPTRVRVKMEGEEICFLS